MSASRWLPLILSAFVYPGAGQFAQKRAVWGLVYALSFTFFLGVGLRLLVPPAWEYALAILAGEPPPAVEWISLMKPLAVAAGIFVANLYDAWWNTIKPPSPAPPKA